MSAISDYAAKVQTSFNEISQSVDEISTHLTGVTADVASLKDIINKLQNNPGPISQEDQALLDQGVAQVQGLSDKLKPLAQAITDLDAQTDEPPPVPPAA